MREALAVLDTVGELFGHTFTYREALLGGEAIDKTGEPLPQRTVTVCRSCGAVLLGAVGGPKWADCARRPEQGLLGLRLALGLYANLRPALLRQSLMDACPLKPEVAAGFDLLIVRELTGGIYFGKRGRADGAAFDTEEYTEEEIARVGRVGFEQASARRGRLCSVDKANVLETSRLWRETMRKLSAEYPAVEYGDMYVDNAAMQLVRRPGQFDVIVTSNLFGDILSDEAGILTGSIGLLPSASIGDGAFGLYEPVHGSAPDIAGTGKANPCAMILSAAMMLRLSFGLRDEALAVENAVEQALGLGARTADMPLAGTAPISCARMGERIRAKLTAVAR
jgi:3-isopropylmalate dehydrogenase